MAIAYVRENGSASASGSSVTVSIATAPTAGNVLVARIGFRASGTITVTGVSDTKGNTWSVDGSVDNSNGHVAVASTAMDIGTLTAADSITVALSGTATNGVCAIVDEFSGLATSSRVDVTGSGSGTGTSRSAGTATTVNASDLLVTCYAGNGTESSYTSGNSQFTTKYKLYSTTAFVEGDYAILSSAGSQSPTATGGTSLTTEGVFVTYKAGSGGVTSSMTITNATDDPYWLGPFYLAGGAGTSQITVDDTSETSRYLLDDATARTINTLYDQGKISVTGAASPFPRPVDDPALIHGNGSPEGLVYAPQASLYIRKDITGSTTNVLYGKTTSQFYNTGWVALAV